MNVTIKNHALRPFTSVGRTRLIAGASKGFKQPEQSSKEDGASQSNKQSRPSAPSPQQTQSSPATKRIEPPVKKEDVVPSTPQVVVDRMFGRMITCAALPVVLGLMLLPVFFYLKEANEDFPMWIVYLSQTFTFGGGLLGITYGIMSTSWDPTREGTVLGFDEFRANLPVLLNRGKK